MLEKKLRLGGENTTSSDPDFLTPSQMNETNKVEAEFPTNHKSQIQ